MIVNEANRINSRKHGGYGGRAAAFQRSLRDGANGAQGGGLFWYCPFCDDLGEDFLQELITRMECFKLIPGQHLFRNLDGANTDFLVVLTRGRLMASGDAARPQALKETLVWPLVPGICSPAMGNLSLNH